MGSLIAFRLTSTATKGNCPLLLFTLATSTALALLMATSTVHTVTLPYTVVKSPSNRQAGVHLCAIWLIHPPPGPTNKTPHCLRDHKHGSLTRDSPKFPSLPQNGSAQIYMEYRSFDSVLSCSLSDRLR